MPLAEEIEASRKARETIRGVTAFDPTPIDDAQRWWQRPQPVDSERLGALYDALGRSALRSDMRRWDRADWAAARGTRYDLPFYQDYSLFGIEDLPWQGGRRTAWIVCGTRSDDGPVCALATLSTPIHSFNAVLAARNELRIDRHSNAAYLAFFCRFVSGDLGPFWILEDEAGLAWASDAPESVEARGSVASALHPMERLTSDEPDDGVLWWRFAALIRYGPSIFYSRLRVFASGAVDMEDDVPCFAALPLEPVDDLASTAVPFASAGPLGPFRFRDPLPVAGASHAVDHGSAVDGHVVARIAAKLVAFGVVNFRLPAEFDRRVIVRATALPFYTGYSLVQVTDRRGLVAQSCFSVIDLDGDDDAPACFLGRAEQDLLDFNDAVAKIGRLRIDADTAAAYVEFYNRPYARADAYRYTVVSSPGELRWRGGSEQDADRIDAERRLEPPRSLSLLRPDPEARDGFWLAVYFRRSRDLGYLPLHVAPDGRLHDPATSEIVIDANLPIFPIVWDERSQFVLRRGAPGRP